MTWGTSTTPLCFWPGVPLHVFAGRLDLVAVAAPVLLLHVVPGRSEVGDDAIGGALDARLRQMVHWPAGREYALLADDLAAEGKEDDAALLRQIAATDTLLTEAKRPATAEVVRGIITVSFFAAKK